MLLLSLVNLDFSFSEKNWRQVLDKINQTRTYINNETMSRRLALILAGVLPVVFLVVLGLAVYIPSLLVKPKHDFIYFTGRDYQLAYTYQFQNGQISRLERPQNNERGFELNPSVNPDTLSTPKLFRHNVSSNSSSQISLAEANQLNLSGGDSSPDGFKFSGNYNNTGPFGIGRSDYAYYLTGNGVNLKQNITGDTQIFDDSVRLLAWVN
jgi:hypothetical protein